MMAELLNNIPVLDALQIIEAIHVADTLARDDNELRLKLSSNIH